MSNQFQSEPYYYKLYGDYALFTDPLTRGGGERYSYQVPTYEALKGITEQIYWKPTLVHHIDEMIVMNEIRSESIGTRPVYDKGMTNDLSYYTYLTKVEYLIKGHFEWVLERPELKQDRNPKKHEAIFKRSLSKGGRRDIFIGTRECIGFVEEISETDFYEARSFYNEQQLSLGLMFHSFTYPSDNTESDTELISNFDNYLLDKGHVQFKRPSNTLIHHHIGQLERKKFELTKNVKSVEEE